MQLTGSEVTGSNPVKRANIKKRSCSVKSKSGMGYFLQKKYKSYNFRKKQHVKNVCILVLVVFSFRLEIC